MTMLGFPVGEDPAGSTLGPLRNSQGSRCVVVQVGKFMSELLTLGFADTRGAVVLSRPDQPVPDRSRVF
jgi:hypothetical protein